MSSVWGFLRRNYLIFNPPVAPKQDDVVRFGILGAARIAPVALITPAMSHGEVVVQSVAARDRTKAAAFAAKHGIPDVKDSYQALIDDPSIDAVYIPLPNGLHYEWALKALQAGKHILLEKPSVSNAREAEALFGLPLLKGPNAPVLLEAFHYRFQPSWQFFLTLVDQDSVEHVKTSGRIPWFMTTGDGDIRFQYDLAGGALMDLGTYCVSGIRQTFGREAEECLEARFETMPAPEERTDYAWRIDEGGGTAETEGGLRAASLNFGVPRLSVSHKAAVVDDPKLPPGQEKTRKRRIEFENFMLGGVWHRIDVEDEFVVKSTQTGEVVRRWTEKTTRKTYTFEEAGLEGRGDGVWVDGEDSINQMRMIDMAYEKAGLPVRRSPGVAS
ncbi:oxidoreductase domain containing protein [Colletotrichum higginsianum]|nr:oxidoreductase domain containing protein [Colletotrichum higginsianum]